jgi:hypothetical protein
MNNKPQTPCLPPMAEISQKKETGQLATPVVSFVIFICSTIQL